MKENPSAVRSKQWLQDSILKLMSEKPYSGITISEICKGAGLTRPTFYQHFKNKDEVILAFLDTLFEKFSVYISQFKIITIFDLAFHFFSFWKEHYDFIALLEKNGMIDLLSRRFPLYLDKLFSLIDLERPSVSLEEQAYTNALIRGGLVSVLKMWIVEEHKPDVTILASYVGNLFSSQNK